LPFKINFKELNIFSKIGIIQQPIGQNTKVHFLGITKSPSFQFNTVSSVFKVDLIRKIYRIEKD